MLMKRNWDLKLIKNKQISISLFTFISLETEYVWESDKIKIISSQPKNNCKIKKKKSYWNWKLRYGYDSTGNYRV